MKTILLLVASDEAIPRAGLAHLLGTEPQLRVIGQSDFALAADQSQILHADICLLHVPGHHPGVSKVIRTLRTAAPSTAIMVLGRETNLTVIGLMLAAGAAGYVLLRESPRNLILAIRTVAHGRRYIDPNLGDTLFDSLIEQAISGTRVLSTREEQVVRMFALGHSTKEIAAKLKVSRKSVETYLARTREKLNLHSRAEIVSYAVEEGLIGTGLDREAS
jgi:DNA-binding NarL/FixJ family response regulator